ncbi:hypothetical protein COW36_17775 [bacterium (Candidatus Blackallbacteria) CG17_big_fil_post_rev_8_21_14_2_50_48_46]|uniref:ARG and Rhodanese-Phosphatase-superfamily-associated domain-containing protein n=1 Tax=bacterium (Candidatus Blackallbacteria) CG17_big_fil_post_rev_8_21_14_2_50_48_46 TaxID=2014261 RepID=A0A2M7G0W2_9BACT|nr:MAG: hypothetical protein COW64_00950 [bacterium (Candidatus Blackallbacteria) CG18_big_fil_WC_8_21_14_2_50_49_26]PIW15266.1 MAG: hypothetical protein COW36_17775 [bacterium (Candidatus Blackallbacteria) CG17_big_fil_post_rev_8_21_14_2_50_48_46]PIW45225.1 MAG: hypothetical protein COW20_21240 [bacterium (Candidatus Blackallbacteria) CG13_big_fil_rev_8_21_14_2_50_49_14]
MPQWNQTQLAQHFNLSGISCAPGQIWNGIRLVPLLREKPIEDLRLFRERNSADLSVVEVDDDLNYFSYIPHSYVLHWRPDGVPDCVSGTQIRKKNQDGKRWKHAPVAQFERMAKKRGTRQLRFLPQHLGIESYLHQFFNVPKIDWRDTYSRSAISKGLLPRSTWMLSGWGIDGFRDALRLFERYPQQIGMMLFVGDLLAAIQVCPSAQDYQALHSSFLEDLYGEIFWYYSRFPGKLPELQAEGDSQAQSFEDLRVELQSLRGEISAFQTWMANGLLETPIRSQEVQGVGPYHLHRFISELSPPFGDQTHLGEFICDSQGRLAYLKTCRLSRQQSEQAWLLEQLDAQLWHLEKTAKALNISHDQLVLKMEKLGLGKLLKPQVLDQVHKREREKK